MHAHSTGQQALNNAEKMIRALSKKKVFPLSFYV